MIRRTDSPYTNEVLNHPLPPKFRLPQLESYDGYRIIQDANAIVDDPKQGDE